MSSDRQSPPGQRPTWLTWAIVGGSAAVLAIVGTIIIVSAGKNGGQGGSTPGVQPNPAAVALENLRAHLPAKLRFASECAQASPLAYATATITCTWDSSHVPSTASYSLFDDDTAMLKSATGMASGSDYGSECNAAGDFNGDGGQMIWRHEDRDRGTVWCYLNADGDPEIVWTDTAPKILAVASTSAKDDAGQLLDWFGHSGQASLEAIPSPQQPPQPSRSTNSPPKPNPSTKTPPTVRPSTDHPGQTNVPTGNGPTGQDVRPS